MAAVPVSGHAGCVSLPCGSPYQTLSVTIAAKGKVKVIGTLADGTKVSASGQLIVGEEWCCVPVRGLRFGHGQEGRRRVREGGVGLPNGRDGRSPSAPPTGKRLSQLVQPARRAGHTTGVPQFIATDGERSEMARR